MGRFVAFLLASILWATALVAQDNEAERLADIRLQLLDLYERLEELRRELTPTGNQSREVGISDLSSLRRIDGLEQELRGAISKIEELEFAILRIAADGNNQIRDLEFMLVEMSGGDISSMHEGVPLGTEIGQTSSAVLSEEEIEVTDLSFIAEEKFNAALEEFQRGDTVKAREQFEAVIGAYPNGKFAAEAHFFVGETYLFEESWKQAGQAFLAAFNHQHSGNTKPKALLRLGEALSRVGSTDQACEILKNVGNMFPDSGEAGLADAKVAELDCG